MIGDLAKAVVIEDDKQTRNKLIAALRQAGFTVRADSVGIGGARLADRFDADLVVVGFGLSDIDGFETIRRIHTHLDAYVLALLDSHDEIDAVSAFDAGADGCSYKPLREREFRARVDAFKRRMSGRKQFSVDAHATHPSPSLRHGDLYLNPTTWEVVLHGEPVALTATEFGILHLLMRFPGRVFSKRELAQRGNSLTGGSEHFATDSDWRRIEVHVANLRRKLGDSAHEGKWIETVRGVGYRFRTERSEGA